MSWRCFLGPPRTQIPCSVPPPPQRFSIQEYSYMSDGSQMCTITYPENPPPGQETEPEATCQSQGKRRVFDGVIGVALCLALRMGVAERRDWPGLPRAGVRTGATGLQWWITRTCVVVEESVTCAPSRVLREPSRCRSILGRWYSHAPRLRASHGLGKMMPRGFRTLAMSSRHYAHHTLFWWCHRG